MEFQEDPRPVVVLTDAPLVIPKFTWKAEGDTLVAVAGPYKVVLEEHAERRGWKGRYLRGTVQVGQTIGADQADVIRTAGKMVAQLLDKEPYVTVCGSCGGPVYPVRPEIYAACCKKIDCGKCNGSGRMLVAKPETWEWKCMGCKVRGRVKQ